VFWLVASAELLNSDASEYGGGSGLGNLGGVQAEEIPSRAIYSLNITH